MRYLSKTVQGLVVLALVMTGCSDPYAGRFDLSGKVTLEGQPLQDGTITFEPLENQKTASGGTITNGEFKVERKDGLAVGKYRVLITAGDGKTPANEEEAGGPSGANILSMDLIPPEWNTESKQEITIKDGENKFEFTIPKKNVAKKKAAAKGGKSR